MTGGNILTSKGLDKLISKSAFNLNMVRFNPALIQGPVLLLKPTGKSNACQPENYSFRFYGSHFMGRSLTL